MTAKKTAPKKTPPKPKVGMSMAELNAKYNPAVIIPTKIREALKKLGNAAVEEQDFRALVGTNSSMISAYRDEFIDHVIPVRRGGATKYIWAGTTEFAQEARDALARG